jgi:dihydroorotate dehydrogenase
MSAEARPGFSSNYRPDERAGREAVPAPGGPKPALVLDPYPLVKPLLLRLDPETAHEWTLRALATGIVPGPAPLRDPILACELFGHRLDHPIGLAAGFDKNGRVYRHMFAQGFSFVEIGGVTPLPQAGNPRPRVFRLPGDAAVINRMGFPNAGAAAVERRLGARARPGTVGINLASNTQAADPIADFTGLVARFARHADYLTLDISCPNTANGQLFLDPVRLRDLLAAVAAVSLDVPRPAIVAKLSPDIEPAALRAIVDVLLAARIDGIVVSNTTAQRPGLTDAAGAQAGGLSGRPLFAASTAMLATVRRLSGGSVPLIGVGGIASGADAYAKIRAGASAVQLYTALIYGGTALVARIGRELAALLRRDGFNSLVQAAAN